MVAAMMGTVTMKAERAGTTRDRVCAGYAAGSERYVLCSSCPPRAHAACAQPLLISAVLPFWLSSPRLSPPLPRFRYLPPPLPAAPCRRPAPSPLLSPSYASGLLSCAGRGRLGKLFLFLLPPAHLPTPSIPTASAPRYIILPIAWLAPGLCSPPPSTPGPSASRRLLPPPIAMDAQRPSLVDSFYRCRHLQHSCLRGASAHLTLLTVTISVSRDLHCSSSWIPQN